MHGKYFLAHYLLSSRSLRSIYSPSESSCRFCPALYFFARSAFFAGHFILFAFLLIPLNASAMSFLNPLRVCVFSEVSARLVLKGEPVRGAKVLRKWSWHKERSDEATTDANGYVNFPPRYESSIARLLPVELVVGQQLSIFIDENELIFWSNAKREPGPNAEYGGNPFRLVCELTGEDVLIEEYGSLMLTMCALSK